MKGLWTIVVLGVVFVSGCYESYQNYGDGRDSFPVVTCEVAVTTNALDGATITIDGESVGDVARDITVELAMGRHTFAASAVGYFQASKVVEVTRECEPVELRLLPNLNGWYNLVLYNRSYYRFVLQIRQDENSEVLAADDWREGSPTSEHPHEHFSGTVSFDREVHLLSLGSPRTEFWGEWTPPRGGGVARIEGAYDYISEEGGDWVAESRP